jgi:septal ring factor EnvC (AmiA/AmiB activator)
MYDAAEREMDLYRAEIARITAQRDEARADRDDYAVRLKAADQSWTRLAAERDRLRELLDEIGVTAANAPEDGDSFGLLEEIAMRIAAADVATT